jgi:hypothetical protein
VRLGAAVERRGLAQSERHAESIYNHGNLQQSIQCACGYSKYFLQVMIFPGLPLHLSLDGAAFLYRCQVAALDTGRELDRLFNFDLIKYLV